MPRVGNTHNLARGTFDNIANPLLASIMIRLMVNPKEHIKNKNKGSVTSFRAALLKTYTLLNAIVARIV